MSTRATSPLRPADDAAFIDSGDLSAEQTTEIVLRQVAEAQALAGSSLLAEHTPDVVALTRILRATVRSALPWAVEKINPGWHALAYHDPEAGYVAGIFPGEESAKLGLEHGVDLPDPDGLLEGDGSQVRYVVVDAWDPDLREPIIDMLHAAEEFGSA